MLRHRQGSCSVFVGAGEGEGVMCAAPGKCTAAPRQPNISHLISFILLRGSLSGGRLSLGLGGGPPRVSGAAVYIISVCRDLWLLSSFIGNGSLLYTVTVNTPA